MAEKAKKSTKTKTATKSSTAKKVTKVSAKSSSSKKKCYDGTKAKFALFGIIVAAIIAVVIAVVCAVNLRGIDDSYFVSDDTKYVINLTNDSTDDDGSDVVAVHVVYYHEGDKVTGAKSYYEFASNDAAKAAYDEIFVDVDSEDQNEYKLSGKYVVVVAPESVYANMTTEDVETLIRFYDLVQDGDVEGAEALMSGSADSQE